jgi:tripartite-type tricarboxylate transporter receptor subunit TctC
MPLTRREAIAALGGGIAGHATGSAWAQENHAGKTIKLIVPYPAGGTTDLLGRMIAEQLETGLCATVIGAEQVAKAPDGTTLLWRPRPPCGQQDPVPDAAL